jgi:hypothetical protein
VAEPLQLLRLLREPTLFVGLERHGQVSVHLEIAVDLELAQRHDRAVEVLASEALEQRHLAGEARDPVRDSMGERRGDETATAPGGPVCEGLRLEQHHLAVRLDLLCLEGGPQSAQAAADDRKIGFRVALERRAWCGRIGRVQPVGARYGVGVGAVVRRSRR